MSEFRKYLGDAVIVKESRTVSNGLVICIGGLASPELDSKTIELNPMTIVGLLTTIGEFTGLEITAKPKEPQF